EQLSDKNLKPLIDVWIKSLNTRLPDEPRSGLVAHYGLDGSLFDSSGGYHHGFRVSGDPTFGPGQVGKALSLDGQTRVTFGNIGPPGPFTLAVWLKPEGDIPIAALQNISDSSTRRGWEILFDSIGLVGIQKRAAPLTIRLTSHWPDDAIQIRTKEP